MPHPQATTHCMKTDASVLVVIVNYRTAALVADCLRWLQDQVLAHGSTGVTVVDNVSGDRSADVIDAAIQASGWTPWATLLRAPLNGGFAYGNNMTVTPALQGGLAPDLRDFIRHSALLNGDLPVNRAVFADVSTAATPTTPK